MDPLLVVEIVTLAFVTGSFVAAVRGNVRQLVSTQKEQSRRFDRLEGKLDKLQARLDVLPCHGACSERV